MTALLVLGAMVLLVYATFLFYVAVMGLKRARDTQGLTRAQAVLGYPLLFLGLVVDALMDVVVMTLLLLELPRELTVTSRLIRHKFGPPGWRQRVASWFCREVLDSLDPSGCHCKQPGS